MKHEDNMGSENNNRFLLGRSEKVSWFHKNGFIKIDKVGGRQMSNCLNAELKVSILGCGSIV